MPTTPPAMVKVDNVLQWGKLVKTWATGRSYFEDEIPPIPVSELPIPRDLAELKRQAARVRAGLTIVPEDGVSGLTVVQYSADTLVIRLPPKERIDAKEEELRGDGQYPFPSYIADFQDRDLTQKERLDAHACRIGDYTLSQCA